MATCIPPVERAQSESSAELRLLEALDAQLPAEFTVLHSVAWISKPGTSGPRDGESDLLVVHQRLGLLVIEVKGGRVSLDYRDQRWSSIDRHGIEHQIKNPFDQAKRGKYGILEKLRENPAWQRLGIRRFNIGHAAFLPDVGDGSRLRGPDAPGEIIGDRGDKDRLRNWTEQALHYWAQDEAHRLDELGQRGVDTIVATFARRAATRPLLSARIQDEERERVVLTERQARILDVLQRQRRVMVAGGAGTGKTLIAREKAVRASDDGMRTLLVCYNRPLADHLREQCAGQASQLHHHRISEAGPRSSRATCRQNEQASGSLKCRSRSERWQLPVYGAGGRLNVSLLAEIHRQKPASPLIASLYSLFDYRSARCSAAAPGRTCHSTHHSGTAEMSQRRSVRPMLRDR